MDEDESQNLPVESEETDQALDTLLDKLNLPAHTHSDYELVRKALREAVDKGQTAMIDSLNLAQAIDHPRAYEVFATVMKNLADVSEKLMDHQKAIREVTGQKTEGPKTQTNNVIFTGSTKELQQLLKGNMDDLEIDVTPED